MIYTLHIEQHSDYTIRAVLGKCVREVVCIIFYGRISTALRIRYVGPVAVVEVPRGTGFRGSVTLSLALPSTFPTRVYYVITNTLDPETELRDAADRC